VGRVLRGAAAGESVFYRQGADCAVEVVTSRGACCRKRRAPPRESTTPSQGREQGVGSPVSAVRDVVEGAWC